MNIDELERQLQRKVLRSVPAAWKEDILKAARAAAGPGPAVAVARGSGGWREWLWPCPPAWAALAAVWLVIVALHFSDSISGLAPASHIDNSRPSQEVLSVLAEQRRLFIELSDAVPRPAAPEKPPVWKPRSARHIAIVPV
jgi:hypothetical protein